MLFNFIFLKKKLILIQLDLDWIWPGQINNFNIT